MGELRIAQGVPYGIRGVLVVSESRVESGGSVWYQRLPCGIPGSRMESEGSMWHVMYPM